MSIYQLTLDGISLDNYQQGYFVTFGENQYKFKIYWKNSCNCAFLDILDMSDNQIIAGRALVNNLKIRTYKLPYILNFIHINNETYEPTIETLSTEFVFEWDDEVKS